MRVVFVGATRFGRRCLEAAAALPSCEIAGVLTAPETFSISYNRAGVRNVLHADFQPVAARLGVPIKVMRTAMTDPDIVAQFRAWAPQLIVLVGWYHLVPRALRELAPAIGLHASLLPDYSGGAPLVWAMINGEERTGITLFRLADGVDDGPIIDQKAIAILEADTIATLYARIEDAGLELLRAQLPRIAEGRAMFTAQDENRRRIFPQRSPEDGRIDWRWPAERIYDFIRAQTRPYPGAFTSFKNQKLTVWKASKRPGDFADGLPGRIGKTSDGRACVACGGRGSLALDEVEYAGKVIDGVEFFRRSDAGAAARLGEIQ